jgi:anti-sigma-K factor RskA
LSAAFAAGIALPARLWDSAGLWRCAAGVLATLALALLVAAGIAREPPDFSSLAVLAVVRDRGEHPVWAIRLARAAHQIAVDNLRPQPAPPGRVYQLWLKPSSGAAPRPLGLLPRSGRKIIAVTPANSRMLAGVGELMVTLEQTDGSPNPGPSGPALFQSSLDGPEGATSRVERD